MHHHRRFIISIISIVQMWQCTAFFVIAQNTGTTSTGTYQGTTDTIPQLPDMITTIDIPPLQDISSGSNTNITGSLLGATGVREDTIINQKTGSILSGMMLAHDITLYDTEEGIRLYEDGQTRPIEEITVYDSNEGEYIDTTFSHASGTIPTTGTYDLPTLGIGLSGTSLTGALTSGTSVSPNNSHYDTGLSITGDIIDIHIGSGEQHTDTPTSDEQEQSSHILTITDTLIIQADHTSHATNNSLQDLQADTQVRISSIQSETKQTAVFQANTRITSTTQQTLGLDDIALKSIATQEIDFSQEILGGVKLGPEDDHLLFSQPVEITIPVDSSLNGQELALYVHHAGDDKFGTKGLSTNSNTSCDEEGISSNESSIVTIQNSEARFYTCGASTFIVTYVGGATLSNFVDNTSDTKTITITTGHVSSGSTINDINIIIDFHTIDGEDPTSPGAGQAYADENSFSIESPNGTVVDLLVIDTYTNTANAPRVTVTFDDAAATAPSGLPATGTFLPTDNLSDFNGEDPLGDWIFTYGDDTAQDGLILFSVSLEITDDATCGNGTIEGAEGCDDGNTTSGDGCNASCKVEDSYNCNTSGSGAQLATSCASGICDETETTPTCEAADTCGNSILEGSEQCDDGNTTTGDGCNASCEIEYCGNGTINLSGDIITTILLEDFESANGTTQTNGTTLISSTGYTLTYNNGGANGRVRYGTNAVQNNGGGGAATLDVTPTGTFVTNRLVFEVDISAYTSATNLELGFDRSDHGDEDHAEDIVEMRGSDTDSRFTIYDWKVNDIGNGTYQSVSGIDIDAELDTNGQTPSSTFQIRFGQRDNWTAISSTTADGFSLDNVEITNTVPGPLVDETCDDGNMISGDGCSNTCQIESGYTCAGEPSVCTACNTEDIIIAYLASDINTGDTTITFSDFTNYTYNSTPLVIATPNSQNNSNNYPIPVVSNVSTTGAIISLCVDDGNTTCATSPSSEDFALFVIDVDKAACVDHIEAGTTSIATNGSDTAFTFDDTFTNTPYVFTTPQTSNQGNNIGAVAWVDDNSLSTAGGDFVGCVHQGVGDTCTGGQPNETLGWVAIDPLLFVMTGFQTDEEAIGNSTWTSISFSPTYTATPGVMVTQNSDNGGQDPQYAWARDITTDDADIRYCEMDGTNDCDTHTSEDVMRFSLPFSTIASTGDVCIFAPDTFAFSGMYESLSITQTLEQQFTGYFQVQDDSGADSGRYTTLEITHFSGSSYGETIANSSLERYSSGVTLLSGSTNPDVILASGWNSYRVASGTFTFLLRDPGPNSNTTGTYGTLPWLRFSIPPYTRPDTYTAEIVYTLYEN